MNDIPDFGWGDSENELVRGSGSSAPSGDPYSTASLIDPAEVAKVRERMAMEKVDEDKWTVGGIPEGVTREDFTTVLSGCYVAYTSNRQLPDMVEIQRYVKTVPATIIAKILASDEFTDAAVARGIPWDNFNGLTAEQMLVAQIVTNPTDKRPLRAKLKSAGVTYAQYRAWMHQPVFSQYMNRITEGMLVDHIPDFNTVLTNKALSGDINALKYVNELSGRHDPNRQQVLDLQAIVQNLLEIIQRNVTDPATFQRIAAEFSLAVNSKQTIRGEIENGPHT